MMPEPLQAFQRTLGFGSPQASSLLNMLVPSLRETAWENRPKFSALAKGWGDYGGAVPTPDNFILPGRDSAFGIGNDVAVMREIMAGEHPFQQGMVDRMAANHPYVRPIGQPPEPGYDPRIPLGQPPEPGYDPRIPLGQPSAAPVGPIADLSGIGAFGINYDEVAPQGTGEPGIAPEVAALSPLQRRRPPAMRIPDPSYARTEDLGVAPVTDTSAANDLQTYSIPGSPYSDQQRAAAWGSQDVANLVGRIMQGDFINQDDYNRVFGEGRPTPQAVIDSYNPRGPVADQAPRRENPNVDYYRGTLPRSRRETPRLSGVNPERLAVAQAGLEKARRGRKAFTQEQKDQVRDIVLANRARRRQQMVARKEARARKIPLHMQYAMMANAGRGGGASPISAGDQIKFMGLMQKAQNDAAKLQLDRAEYEQSQRSADIDARIRMAQLAMGQDENMARNALRANENQLLQERNLMQADPTLAAQFIPPEIRAQMEAQKKQEILDRAKAALAGISGESPSEAVAILRNEGVSDEEIQAMLRPGATLDDPGGWSFGNFITGRSPQGQWMWNNPGKFIREFRGG